MTDLSTRRQKKGARSRVCNPALVVLSLLLLAGVASPAAPYQKKDESKRHTSITEAVPTQSLTPTPAPLATLIVTQRQPIPTPEKAAAKTETQNWHKWFWPPIWSGWALVLVTIVAACAAVRTLRAIEQQVRIGQASTEIARLALSQNRPYLWPIGIEVEDNRAERRISGKVLFKNFGTGPAEIIDYHMRVEVFEKPWPDALPILYTDDDVEQMINPIIGVQETRNVGSFSLSLTVTQDQAIDAGVMSVAFHGRICYRGLPHQQYESCFLWYHARDSEQGPVRGEDEFFGHT
jgi:hypothetical protein